MTRLLTTLAATAVLGSAQAAILIDHFDSPLGGQSATVLVPPGVVGSSATSTVAAALALGGWRTLYVQVTGGNLTAGGTIQALANDPTAIDNYQYLSSVFIDGWSEVQYDANGAGLSQDLSSCTGILLDDVYTDLATAFTVFLTDGAAVTSQANFVSGVGFNGDVNFTWADFAGGANLTDIDIIVLRVDAPRGGDVAIHSIQAVPEPAETALAFAALAGLGVLSRRFRK